MDAFALTEGIVPDNSQDGHNSEPAAGKLPEGANKFQRAIAAWRGLSPQSQNSGPKDPVANKFL